MSVSLLFFKFIRIPLAGHVNLFIYFTIPLSFLKPCL